MQKKVLPLQVLKSTTKVTVSTEIKHIKFLYINLLQKLNKTSKQINHNLCNYFGGNIYSIYIIVNVYKFTFGNIWHLFIVSRCRCRKKFVIQIFNAQIKSWC